MCALHLPTRLHRVTAEEFLSGLCGRKRLNKKQGASSAGCSRRLTAPGCPRRVVVTLYQAQAAPEPSRAHTAPKSETMLPMVLSPTMGDGETRP